jgi:hypothetical protein
MLDEAGNIAEKKALCNEFLEVSDFCGSGVQF